MRLRKTRFLQKVDDAYSHTAVDGSAMGGEQQEVVELLKDFLAHGAGTSADDRHAHFCERSQYGQEGEG